MFRVKTKEAMQRDMNIQRKSLARKAYIASQERMESNELRL